MLECHISAVHVVDSEGAENAALRDRLKGAFPAGAARRMTLLGMMIGSALGATASGTIDSLVYSSEFGESVSLENYLRSFPTPSPTAFQSSIHPSAVQQVLIQRQRPVRQLIPLAGGPELVLQAALAALTDPADEVVWCGGDESGTWLRDLGAAANRSFAFAVVLRKAPAGRALGRLRLVPAEGTGSLSHAAWFERLRDRVPWSGLVGTGWRLDLEWA